MRLKPLVIVMVFEAITVVVEVEVVVVEVTITVIAVAVAIVVVVSTLHSPTYSDRIPVGLFCTFLHIMYSSHIHSFFANSAWTPVGLFKILF